MQYTLISSKPGNKNILTAEDLWWKKRGNLLRSLARFFSRCSKRKSLEALISQCLNQSPDHFFPQKVNHTQLVACTHKLQTGKRTVLKQEIHIRIIFFKFLKQFFPFQIGNYFLHIWNLKTFKSNSLSIALPSPYWKQGLFWSHIFTPL
jgi:hypothetical protein